jgi:tRNA threonylcarbamoyladenosine biosynthesis protein TsaE
MPKYIEKISGVQQLPQVAQALINSLNHRSLVALKGKMGAGKTTFIKALCLELGVEDQVNSPTFSIVNQYETNKGETIYHFDFYRIETLQEALQIGVFEYWDSGSLCLMEWPEKVEKLLPPECVYLTINEHEITGEREFQWEIQ